MAVSYEFGRNGTFCAIQHVDGGKQVKTRGSYVTEFGNIRLKVAGHNTVSKAYRFKGDLLEMRDADADFYITFQQPLAVTRYPDKTVDSKPRDTFWAEAIVAILKALAHAD